MTWIHLYIREARLLFVKEMGVVCFRELIYADSDDMMTAARYVALAASPS